MADIQSFDLKTKVQPESQQLPTHVSGSESSLSESIVGSDGDGRGGRRPLIGGATFNRDLSLVGHTVAFQSTLTGYRG